jgi:hypothetical protein
MKSCFVISPIGEEGSETRKEADRVFNNIIRPATRRFRGELTVKRADHIASPGSITNEIIKMLRESEIVIADLTGWNPNVVYELAVRHFVNKPTILIISTKESRKPFDLQNERIVRYDTTDLETGTRSADALEAHIESCLSEDKDRVWSPSYLHELVKSRNEKSDASFMEAFRMAFAALQTEVGEVKETIGKMNTQAAAYSLEKLSPVQIAAISTKMEQAAGRARDVLQGLGDLAGRLETTTAEASRAIATASDRLISSLSFKTDHIGEEFAEIAQGIEDMLTDRLDRVIDAFSEKALVTVDMMVGRSQELTDSIVDTSSKIAEKIAASAEEINSTLQTSGQSLVLDLKLHGGEVASKVEQASSRITDAVVARTTKTNDALLRGVEQLVSAIMSRTDAMKDMLATRLAACEEVSGSMLRSIDKLNNRVGFDAASDQRLNSHVREVDRILSARVREVTDALGRVERVLGATPAKPTPSAGKP